jgi:NAD-dependent dihydropyrimidine dehydrogenase PreA subunit
MTRLKDATTRIESNFRAVVDAEECIACGDCVDRCPMEAIAMETIEVEEVAAVNRDRCIGCGLCATACPAEAIVLERVAEVQPPADYREMLTCIGGEKGRLETFAEQLHPS